MRATLILTPTILLLFAGSFLARAWLREPPPQRQRPAAAQCARIVSMAPSITETLFALGLGDRVVGVTRYCHYPPEADAKPKIGGYFDPSFEAVLALEPDLVVTLEDDQPTRAAFEKLGLHTLSVEHRNVEGILASIPAIGRTCGVPERAEQIVRDVRTRMRRIQQKTASLPRRSVMIAVDRTFGTGGLEDVYIVGCDGHLDKLVELAGGQNAYRTGSVRFPVVSHEGILRLDPQVIVDVVPEATAAKLGPEKILADWQQVARVEAVRDGRLYVLADDHAVLPGPGFIRLVEHLARLIHPEVDWR